MEPIEIVVRMVPDPALSPNARVTWGQRSRAAADLRAAAGIATWTGLIPRQRDEIILAPELALDAVIFWPPGRKRHDDDNAWAMLKSARDGIASAINRNDRDISLGTLDQKRGDGRVLFILRRKDGSD